MVRELAPSVATGSAAPTPIGSDRGTPVFGTGSPNGDTLITVTPPAEMGPPGMCGDPGSDPFAPSEPAHPVQHRHVAPLRDELAPATVHAQDWETQPIRLTFAAEVPEPPRSSVTAVRASFWYLGDVELLSQRFDARLLCLTPRAEEVHRRHFPREGEKFLSALLRPVEALAASSDGDLEADGVGQLRALGERLARAGMQGQDFSYIGLSLVRAVRDSYTGQWSTSLGVAWSDVRQWIVSALTLGSKDADSSSGSRQPDHGPRSVPGQWGEVAG